jgi:hypothetical protein
MQEWEKKVGKHTFKLQPIGKPRRSHFLSHLPTQIKTGMRERHSLQNEQGLGVPFHRP